MKKVLAFTKGIQGACAATFIVRTSSSGTMLKHSPGEACPPGEESLRVPYPYNGQMRFGIALVEEEDHSREFYVGDERHANACTGPAMAFHLQTGWEFLYPHDENATTTEGEENEDFNEEGAYTWNASGSNGQLMQGIQDLERHSGAATGAVVKIRRDANGHCFISCNRLSGGGEAAFTKPLIGAARFFVELYRNGDAVELEKLEVSPAFDDSLLTARMLQQPPFDGPHFVSFYKQDQGVEIGEEGTVLCTSVINGQAALRIHVVEAGKNRFRGPGATFIGVAGTEVNLDQFLGSSPGSASFSSLGETYQDGCLLRKDSSATFDDGETLVLICNSAREMSLYREADMMKLATLVGIPEGCRFAIGYRGHRNANKIEISGCIFDREEGSVSITGSEVNTNGKRPTAGPSSEEDRLVRVKQENAQNTLRNRLKSTPYTVLVICSRDDDLEQKAELAVISQELNKQPADFWENDAARRYSLLIVTSMNQARQYHAELLNGAAMPAVVHIISHGNVSGNFFLDEESDADGVKWKEIVDMFSSAGTHFVLNSCNGWQRKASAMAQLPVPPASITCWRSSPQNPECIELTRCFFEILCRPGGHSSQIANEVLSAMRARQQPRWGTDCLHGRVLVGDEKPPAGATLLLWKPSAIDGTLQESVSSGGP
uniref:Uncharacterized protein n=1 Tax=Haptolina ericina TaxID=156174 RepID=A0A7S3AGB9_9EUKA